MTPNPADVVGVGATTTQYLYDQFSRDYGGTNASSTLTTTQLHNIYVCIDTN